MTNRSKVSSRPPKRTAYILLVEDEPLNWKAIRRAIRAELGTNAPLIIATTIQQAREELASGKEFAVILFDYSLTDGTSIALINEALIKFGKSVWMVATTSQATHIPAMQKAGCLIHVSKKMAAWAAIRLLNEYLKR